MYRPASKFGLLRQSDPRQPFWSMYKNVLSLLGLLTSGLLLYGVLYSHVRAAEVYPYFTPWSLVEEWAYTYTTSRNYLTFGFLNSGLLQDCSNSPFAADHPYIYTHMPPGPDLLTALVLKFSGNSYFTLRMVLAGLFVVGIWYYYRFAKLILQKLDLPGAGFVILFVGPIAWANIMERSVYALYPLLAFAPYVALDVFYRSGKKRYLYLVILLIFLSSIYIEYSLLAAVAVCWVALYLTKLIRINREHLLLVMSVMASGILLHLLQNLLFLGPEIFFKDLLLTLSNRMVGYPSKEELAAFYTKAHIVHHGTVPVSLREIGKIIERNFRSPLWLPCFIVAGFSVLLSATTRVYWPGRVLLCLKRNTIESIRDIFLMLLWIGTTILVPIFLFPAYSRNVNLDWSRANSYYIAIAQYAMMALALKQIYASSPLYLNMRGRIALLPIWGNRSTQGSRERRVERLLKYVIWVCVTLLTLMLASQVGHLVKQQYRVVRFYNRFINANVFLEDLKQFSGELYATNINTPIVGFYTNTPGFGVCNEYVISPTGMVDTSKCQSVMMRRYDFYAKQTPRYFFLFGKGIFVPGFADTEMITGDGNARLEERLETNFDEIYFNNNNKLFRVFDLLSKADN